MFRCHLQSARHVAQDEFARIVVGRLAQRLVLIRMQEKVVSHAAADEALLDAREGINGAVDVENRTVVGIEVGAHRWRDARRPFAAGAERLVFPVHHIHVGRRSAEVREIALEIGHGNDLLHLAQDALFRAAHDEFALMGRDGAEGATAEAAAMDVDREFDHLVGRNAFPLVFGVWQSRVGKIKRAVDLRRCHWRERRVDHRPAVGHALQKALRMQFVALFFDVAEVGGIFLLVGQAFLVGEKRDVVIAETAWDVGFRFQRHGLFHWEAAHNLAEGVGRAVGLFAAVQEFVFKQMAELSRWEFAHAIDNHVGLAVAEHTFAKALLPVVVVRDAAQRCLDSAEHHRHVGIELLEDLCVDHCWVFRSHVVSAVGTVGIFRTQPSRGGVFVHHGIHTSRCHRKEEAWPPQFLEVAEVAMPVGLRHDANAEALVFEQAADDGGAERRVVNVGVGREENDVGLFPASQVHFFAGGWQPVGELVLFG